MGRRLFGGGVCLPLGIMLPDTLPAGCSKAAAESHACARGGRYRVKGRSAYDGGAGTSKSSGRQAEIEEAKAEEEAAALDKERAEKATARAAKLEAAAAARAAKAEKAAAKAKRGKERISGGEEQAAEPQETEAAPPAEEVATGDAPALTIRARPVDPCLAALRLNTPTAPPPERPKRIATATPPATEPPTLLAQPSPDSVLPPPPPKAVWGSVPQSSAEAWPAIGASSTATTQASGSSSNSDAPGTDRIRLFKPSVDTRLGIVLIGEPTSHPTIVTIKETGHARALCPVGGPLREGRILASVNGVQVWGHQQGTRLLQEARGELELLLLPEPTPAVAATIHPGWGSSAQSNRPLTTAESLRSAARPIEPQPV